MMYKLSATLVIAIALMGAVQASPPMHFQANLQPFDVAGQPVATNATGQARVKVIDDGTALSFQVKVTGIRNLLMAHIHVATGPVTLPVSVTEPAGPIAYWINGGPPPELTVEERVNGSLAEGFIFTDGDTVSWDPVNSLDGTVDGLIDAIKEGRASVIVHTDDLDPDTPAGVAGDSRAGELRGTLQ